MQYWKKRTPGAPLPSPRMAQPDLASKYHKLLEGEGAKDLGWAEELQVEMKQRGLVLEGRPVCPVIRPHFITSRQMQSLAKGAEQLMSAIHRMESVALSTPALMSRMALLPAEKMLAGIEPGYQSSAIATILHSQVNNGTVAFSHLDAGNPVGIAYGEVLGDMFDHIKPMKALRKQHTLSRVNGTKAMLQAILQAWKEFNGKGNKDKKPSICIVGPRLPFQTLESAEFKFLAELFEKQGCRTVVVTPEQIEYRDGIVRANELPVQVVLRRIRLQDFLIRYGLDHPLVSAYRDRAVCMINSFRSEMSNKKAIFDLLTDEALTAKFPVAERKAIQAFVPWTRMVGHGQTQFQDATIDLPDFIRANRETLILKPNDEADEQRPEFLGSEMDDKAWDRALQTALRNSYVVQEAQSIPSITFPLLRYGMLEMRQMRVDVQPQTFLGQMHGCVSWLSTTGSSFSSVAGLAPTYVVEK